MSQPISPASRLQEATMRLAALTDGRGLTGVSHDDADDDAGTVATDDAIGFDPLPLLRALDSANTRAAVIGQVAAILHGSVELTGDLDLLWSGEPAEIPAMLAAFTAASAQLSDDDGAPVALDADAFRRPKVMFRTPSASGDCCTPALPWGGLDVAAFAARADQTVAEDGTLIRYLTLEDLIAMREALGRPKDVRRAAELRQLRH